MKRITMVDAGIYTNELRVLTDLAVFYAVNQADYDEPLTAVNRLTVMLMTIQAKVEELDVGVNVPASEAD